MARKVLPIFFAIAGCLGAQKLSACHTPLDVPCYIVHGSSTLLRIAAPQAFNFDQIKSNYTRALRRDGSSVYKNEYSISRWFNIERGKGTAVDYYLADRKEIVHVEEAARTISRREPVTSSDVPHRNSVKGDETCETAIRHFGNGFRMTDNATVAATHVVKWTRPLGKGRQDVYLAPSLDCIPLKSYRLERNALNLPVYRESDEATSVELREPGHELFKLPVGYRLVNDSQQMKQKDEHGALPWVR